MMVARRGGHMKVQGRVRQQPFDFDRGMIDFIDPKQTFRVSPNTSVVCEYSYIYKLEKK